ncbi:selenium-dependent molybdenum cofactor biosynthesis protein YqeB [Vibrio sp. SCSIO 43137]|uniref:selenium-dependent molybdenum cofactor biosynthesis protein YqeB n=1 Tax=Vibrio sp. SCSIO 43137 TaxID=3021011 RepID=UPI002306EFF7|nr:selenium-dependent molybdenum cofactor biosynthesis protein YqeB [Vibrio sp. SCSIO 43137]WCE31697.1 selenium-dependent molybdenum cofactor biosynthesis protein YqeB [Vibrio sp. SCSIO 43137]
MNIFAYAAELQQQNTPFALASIVDTRGSTPRHSGQMIVLSDGSIAGTIGGGMIERHVIEQSQQAIREKKKRVITGSMTRTGAHAMDMDCGGQMTVFIDVFGISSELILVGAGHVNRAVAKLALQVGFDVTVIDSHPDSLAEEYFSPEVKKVLGNTIEDGINQVNITTNSFVVIATNHEDQSAIAAVARLETRYTGLMASKKKVVKLFRYLEQEGVSEERIQAIYSPIGMDIGAENPEEIAVSVIAELLQVKHNRAGKQLTLSNAGTAKDLVMIRGAGDIATGVASRLFNAGYRVVMCDIEQPTMIRCSVSFGQCLYDGSVTIEGITATRADDARMAEKLMADGKIAVIVDSECQSIKTLKPAFVVDAILAKRNLGTKKDMAPVTIALGPGFTAGEDCHAVIETNRGHYLGSIIYQGTAMENTGVPGNIAGYTHQRVIRAPAEGTFTSPYKLGDIVKEGDVIAHVGDKPVIASLDGMLRGLLNSGLTVTEGFKIADIDPRGEKADFRTVSDKARAIGGGVLEAMLYLSK